MASFATLYSFNQIAHGKFRIGLTNDQYQLLASIFPYFQHHGKEYLIEAMYCQSACSKLTWKSFKLPKSLSTEDYKSLIVDSEIKYGTGFALNFGSYINIPTLYQPYLKVLREVVFKIKTEFVTKARLRLDEIKQAYGQVSKVIGVHARYTDYKGHLILRGNIKFA